MGLVELVLSFTLFDVCDKIYEILRIYSCLMVIRRVGKRI